MSRFPGRLILFKHNLWAFKNDTLNPISFYDFFMPSWLEEKQWILDKIDFNLYLSTRFWLHKIPLKYDVGIQFFA